MTEGEADLAARVGEHAWRLARAEEKIRELEGEVAAVLAESLCAVREERRRRDGWRDVQGRAWEAGGYVPGPDDGGPFPRFP